MSAIKGGRVSENPIPTSVNDYVCECIRRIRVVRGLRVREVAERAGIAAGSYSCLELGRYRLNLDNLFRILHALGADIREVWPGDAPAELPQRVDDSYLQSWLLQSSEGMPSLWPTLDSILEAVADVYGVAMEELMSPSRRRLVVEARMAAAALTREQNHLTLVALSKRLGRDVSGLIHGMSRVQGRRPQGERFKQRLVQIRERLQAEGSRLLRKDAGLGAQPGA